MRHVKSTSQARSEGYGLWVVGCGLWGCGLWGCGLWAVGCGLWVVGCGLWAVVWAERNFAVAILLRFLLVLCNEKKFDFNTFSDCCGLITPLRIALNVSHCPAVNVKMQISSRSLSCALFFPFQVSRKQ